uniref:A-kinase anchor protein 7-like phosphoesterase domain-containing protein n=1 Tax=Ciona intestinalis TaxID=7719 RepID=H2Y1B1_CIOIN
MGKNIKTTEDSNEKDFEKRKRKKRKKKLNDEPGDKTRKLRPNYFIGVRINNPQILGKIRAIQNIVVGRETQLSKTIVPFSTSHVTLSVFHLKEKDDLKRACTVFHNSVDQIRNILNNEPPQFTVAGVGNFRHQVMFAQIRDNNGLELLTKTAEYLDNQMSEFRNSEDKAFKPHLTIMKLSKMFGAKRFKIKKISPSLYEDFVETNFGDEIINRIELLSMLKPKQRDGYYHSEAEICIG